MLAPKKVKHRKVHRGRRRGLATGGTEVHFGDYGLVALEPAWIIDITYFNRTQFALFVVPGQVHAPETAAAERAHHLVPGNGRHRGWLAYAPRLLADLRH